MRRLYKKTGVLCLCAVLFFSALPGNVCAEALEESEEAEIILEAGAEEGLEMSQEQQSEESETEEESEELEVEGEVEGSEEEEFEESKGKDESGESEGEDESGEPEEPESEGAEEGQESEEAETERQEEEPESEEPEEELTGDLQMQLPVIAEEEQVLQADENVMSESILYEEKIELEFIEVAANIEMRAGSIGISLTTPKAGQQNRYEYSGSAQSFTAPADGDYDVYCYGSEGGSTYESRNDGRHKVGSVNCVNGGRGDLRAGRVWLKKGTILSITVAAKGGNSTFHETPDICKDHDVNWEGGIGRSGGATYIVCNGTTILSASGGDAGRMEVYDHPCNGTYTINGTGNRGSMAMNNAGSAAVWQTGQMNTASTGVNAGNGYVLIGVHSVDPGVELSASEKGWTKEDVVITARAVSTGTGLGDAPYCWERDEAGNEIWTGDRTFTVTENGTYTCKIRDTVGNTSQAKIAVTNMDRLAPEAELEADTEEWTNGEVTLTATAEDAAATGAYGESGLVKACYSFEEDESGDPVWVEEAAYVVSQNGTYLCRVRDSAGNITEVSYEVGNIDRLAPETGLVLSTQGWTNQDIVIQVTGDDAQAGGGSGKSGIAENGYAWGIMNADGEIRWEVLDTEGTGPDTDGGADKKSADTGPVWTEKSTYTVTQNGTCLCRVRDRAGNEKETVIRVENIDKLAPVADITASTKEKTDGSVILYMRAEDAAASPKYGSSGIDQYCFILAGKEGGIWKKESSQTVFQNGTYVCKVRDAAGNITELRYMVSNINETGRNSGNNGSSGAGGRGTDEGDGAGDGSSVGKIQADDSASLLVETEQEPDLPDDNRQDQNDFGLSVIFDSVIPVRSTRALDRQADFSTLVSSFRIRKSERPENRKKTDLQEDNRIRINDISLAPDRSCGVRYFDVVIVMFAGGAFFLLLFWMLPAATIYERNDGKYRKKGRKLMLPGRRKIDLRLYFVNTEEDSLMVKLGWFYVKRNHDKKIVYIKPCGSEERDVQRRTMIRR